MSFHNFLARLVVCLTVLHLGSCTVLKSNSTTPKGEKVTTQAATIPLSSTTSSSKVAKPTHAKSSVSSCPIKRHELSKRSCSYQSSGPWALQRISQKAPIAWGSPKAVKDGRKAWDYTFTYNPKWGQNVIAYVIDSGVDSTHRAFQQGQVENGESVAAVQRSGGIESSPLTDTFSHGTGVASVIGGQSTGVAHSVKIFPIKICNSAVVVSYETVVEGINIAVRDWRARRKSRRLRAVINVSYSFSYDAGMQDAFKLAEDAGIIIVHSVVSDHVNDCDPRAKNAGQILVSGVNPVFDGRSVDQYDPRLGYGPCVDICAPGEYIWAADSTGGREVGEHGSSFSAPLVTGVVAALLSSHDGYKNLKPPEFKQKFLKEFGMRGISKLPPATPDRMLIITELLKHGI